jgi:hypothetical protein
MPTVLQREAPSISEIYAAFDDACYGLFRRAMARSRGGVVRVADVLAALAEMLPERTATVLGLEPAAVACLAREPATAPNLLPMSNEPGLRSALACAYVEAEGRPITPLLLLQVVARSRRQARRIRPEAVTPPCPLPVRHPEPRLCLPPPADSVQTVLRRWLEVQSWLGAARDRALQQLASLVPPG